MKTRRVFGQVARMAAREASPRPRSHPSLRCGYFFCSMGAPQHFSAPVPPLVTMTWEPHLPQM
jgi:hypothetical protein